VRFNWIITLAIAGGLAPAVFGQQYPQQYSPSQAGPTYGQEYRNDQYQEYRNDQYNDRQYNNAQYNGGRYDDGQYNNGQYSGDPNGDPAYDAAGVYAPAPPPIPNYAYQRAPMPGPGYSWVDGYWNFLGGQYRWAGGYWTRPPYTGAYWVAPRYSGGRFFAGLWGGGRRDFTRGYSVRNGYRYNGYMAAPRQAYRAPVQRGSGFGSGSYRDSRSPSRGQRGRQR
jgi:hypothetical protein